VIVGQKHLNESEKKKTKDNILALIDLNPYLKCDAERLLGCL